MATIQEPCSLKPSPRKRLDDARAWLDKCSGYIPIEKISYTNHAERLSAIRKELFEDGELVCGVLELCGLQKTDSEKCLQLLTSELQFYQQDHWAFINPSEQNFGAATEVDWSCPPLDIADIPLCGRIFGPFLRLFHAPQNLTASTRFFPFWKLFSSICTKHGFPLKIDEEKKATVERNTAGSSNPFLIFESADLFSAVQCVIENVWSYYAKGHWSPTHVYVQESKFDTFVKLLEFDALNFVKLLGLDLKTGQSVDLPSEGHLKVIQPSSYNHFKFFIGWDPQFLNQKLERGGGVAVLPFRTVQEGVKAVNSSADTCASIWTEISKLKSKVPTLLKVKTVWVNCHGVLDSKTPFGSVKKEIPMNGPELFESLALNLHGDLKTTADIISWGSTEEMTKFVEQEIDSVFKMSLYSKPSTLKVHDRISLLRPLQCFLQAVQGFVPFSTPASVRIHTNDLGLEVKSTILPYDWIIVKVPTTVGASELIHDELACLVATYYGILHGSKVMLYGNGNSLKHILSCVELKILAVNGLLAIVKNSSPISSTSTVLRGTRSKVIFMKDIKNCVENCVTVTASNYAIFPVSKHLFASSQDVLSL